MSERVELVFGLVGPIGSPIHEAEDALEAALKRVGYNSSAIALSTSMEELLANRQVRPIQTGESELERKILMGNTVRWAFRNNSVLAAEAIQQVRIQRRKIHCMQGRDDDEELEGLPVDEHAFIIRQLKRPEEINLLTRAFGKRFIQISVATPLASRIQSLTSRLMTKQSGWTHEKCLNHANELIRRDQNEEDEDTGQRISKIFHLADAFLDGRTNGSLEESATRFVEAFFGKNSIGPSRDEYGSYVAKGASLRSVDLSRQVGAAIFSPDGDLISVGCNDVPKPLGGMYWDEDIEKQRDIDVGGEANKREINRIIFDFLGKLSALGLLAGNPTPEQILGNNNNRDAILESLIGGITEYGRMVHAEMSALTDAARLGRSVQGATIFVTTYPCHNCAKHLVAAGIRRVVFIEPYPKSKAEQLFKNIIEPENKDGSSVSIEHFYGISPRRFRDIFEKGRRQSPTGEIEKWYRGRKSPRLGAFAITGTEQEVHAIREGLFSYD